MQARILEELQTPACDEVRLDLEATEILMLMYQNTAPPAKPAPQVSTSCSGLPLSRSRSPPKLISPREPKRQAYHRQ
jgi:hypothetical protein